MRVALLAIIFALLGVIALHDCPDGVTPDAQADAITRLEAKLTARIETSQRTVTDCLLGRGPCPGDC